MKMYKSVLVINTNLVSVKTYKDRKRNVTQSATGVNIQEVIQE
jgi:hypothetical protein